jgi:hypothetical protein
VLVGKRNEVIIRIKVVIRGRRGGGMINFGSEVVFGNV